MEVVLDIIIVLFWAVFFLATLLGVVNEYRNNRNNSRHKDSAESGLNDDDPVYLMGPFANE